MIKNYPEAKSYVEGFIQYITNHRIAPNSKSTTSKTTRFSDFLRRIGDPQKSFLTVTVSGTSGKGSISQLIASALSQGGYCIGLTQSPHLEDVTERIKVSKINSPIVSQISKNSFICLVRNVYPVIEKMKKSKLGPPSYYEILLGIALLYFAQEKVIAAIVEVGIEGRYDATNVLDPAVFVLSNISLDHTNILGNTIYEIGDEATFKIESLKKFNGNMPVVVSGVIQPKIKSMIRKRCDQSGARLVEFGKDFSVKDIKCNDRGSIFEYINLTSAAGFNSVVQFSTSLLGDFQISNSCLAIACIYQLRDFGILVSDAEIHQALQTVHFPGRYEQCHRSKGDNQSSSVIILDGAHNPAKMRAFIRSLTLLRPKTNKAFIVGFKHDKNFRNMLKAIAPHANQLFFSKYSSISDWGKNTGLEMESIKKVFDRMKKGNQTVTYHEHLPDAIEKAVKLPLDTDIVITGSLYLVGESRKFLRKRGLLNHSFK